MHVIILPGWQHSKKEWLTVSNLLRDCNVHHTVIDLPGFGSEPYQSHLVTTKDVAHWLVTKLQTEHILQDSILVGHSYGGRIAVHLASEDANGIAGLMLIGSPNVYHTDFFTHLKSVVIKLLRPFKILVPEFIKRKFRSADYEKVRGTELQTLFNNIIREDQTHILKSVSVPTHIVWGELDTQVPVSIAREIHTLITNSTLEVITGVGHNIHLEKPNLLAAKMSAYAKTF